MARLIESSLWVDFTRHKSPGTLKALIMPWIVDPAAVLCEPVIFEILRHATKAERRPLEAQFATLPVLADPPDLWQRATKLGQACRQHGFTPGAIDLLIAAVALHHDAEVVTFDADYRLISRATSLRVQLLTRAAA